VVEHGLELLGRGRVVRIDHQLHLHDVLVEQGLDLGDECLNIFLVVTVWFINVYIYVRSRMREER
jgi:hypothetical protein